MKEKSKSFKVKIFDIMYELVILPLVLILLIVCVGLAIYPLISAVFIKPNLPNDQNYDYYNATILEMTNTYAVVIPDGEQNVVENRITVKNDKEGTYLSIKNPEFSVGSHAILLKRNTNSGKTVYTLLTDEELSKYIEKTEGVNNDGKVIKKEKAGENYRLDIQLTGKDTVITAYTGNEKYQVGDTVTVNKKSDDKNWTIKE